MGGSDDSAQRQAEANEAERRREIQLSIDRINSVFNSPNRNKQYDDLLVSTRDYYMRELNKQNAINNRQMKFSLARTGNTGGSLAIDQGRQAGKDYTSGVIETERLAQASQADLRDTDERARLGLISMAQSGLDATTGTQQAASALRNNLQSANASSRVDALGNVFGSFSDIYSRSRDASEARRGERDVYDTIYSPSYVTGKGPKG